MQSQQHMSATQKGLVLMMLVISYGSFAMDSTPECNPNEVTLVGDEEMQKEISKAWGNLFGTVQDFGVNLQNKAQEFWNQEFPTASSNSNSKVVVGSTDEGKENSSKDDSPIGAPISIIWLNKKTALKFGIGAVALITIGATTYVLYKKYKDGTFKKFSDKAKEHPYVSVGTASLITSICGYCAYKYYTA